MSFAFGIQAIQPITGNPHILGFAATQVAADATLLDIWSGASTATRRLRLNKDGQLFAVSNGANAPAYSFEAQKSTGMTAATGGSEDIVYLVSDGVHMVAARGGRRISLGAGAGTIIGSTGFDLAMVYVYGDYAPGQTSNNTSIFRVAGDLTVNAGSTANATPSIIEAGTNFGSSITLTRELTGGIGGVASTLHLGHPGVVLNGFGLKEAATLWIDNAPTEGNANYAILVDEGLVRLNGTLEVGTPPTYAATNVTTDRAFNANATTVEELADVVGTMIADLQTMGLFN